MFSFRSIARRELLADIGIAAGFWLLCALLDVVLGGWQGIVVGLAMMLALTLRRLSPSLALVTAWAGVAVQLLAGLPVLASNLAIFGVLFATAAYGTRRVRTFGLVSAIGGGLLAAGYLVGLVGLDVGFSNDGREVAGRWLFTLILGALIAFVLVLAWLVGLLVRSSRIAAGERRAGIEAEESRRRAEQQSIALEERNRIARDMHDVVAHSLAVVIAQADGARYVLHRDPELAASTLDTIADTARGALGEVRVLLAELRHDSAERPQPGARDVDALIAQMRAAGLRIRATVTGAPPADMVMTHQMALYRILQESLTNALRHGDTAQEVLLGLDWQPDGVSVRVENAGSTPFDPVSSGGHGLPGMKERASIVGGRLSAAPISPTRFLVSAHIPSGGRPEPRGQSQ
ncbi:histidine kinase [Mycetocola reblochoni]|uniref:histidine kinase n=2 Tax=Mycetocola reblochoni TaxID=331618 RepID=A0A1R4K3I3_9MICO|nr:histidine kinase [Mycetocola reblochoni]RLP69889.1 sensor histidine kinase [Mycetocola reblochoni]SJN39011.1 Two-component system, sensor protein [Mycetocola reblochoni REB411]